MYKQNKQSHITQVKHTKSN